MRSMWLSGDITLSDMSGSFGGPRDTRVRARVVPLAREGKNPEWVQARPAWPGTDILARGWSAVSSSPAVQISENLSVLFYWKSGISWHFACSISSAPRPGIAGDAPATEETMGLAKRVIGALLITGAAALSLPLSSCAQERVGIVTNLEGTATVARLALPQPQALRFKDGVYLHDRITTGERSVLTITEVPGTSTIELGAGRISVAVSKGLMKPGEVVEIRTPNAVTAIRGTVVVAEVFPVAGGVQSTITVLRGLVDVTRLDPVTRQRVGPSVDVGARQAVTAIGSNSLSRPAPIGPDEATRLTADFQIVPSTAPSAAATAA